MCIAVYCETRILRDRFLFFLTRRVHGDRVTDFLKLCQIKVSLCSDKMTNPYDPLFRNTRENRVNTRIYLQLFIFLVLCCVLQGMMWPSGYRRCIFSGGISGSDLAVGFFFSKFRPSCFKYHFCCPLLVSILVILSIICVKFAYSIIENCTSSRVLYN